MKKTNPGKPKTASKKELPQKAITLEEFFGLFDPEIVAEVFGPQGWHAKTIEKAVQEADDPKASFSDHAKIENRMKTKIRSTKKGKQCR